MADTKYKLVNDSDSFSNVSSTISTLDKEHADAGPSTMSDENTDTAHTALYSPIPLPLPSSLHSAEDASSPVPTLLDLEHTASDAFVHAACRVHEATVLAKTACHELVYWSSGMKQRDAVSTIRYRLQPKPGAYLQRDTGGKIITHRDIKGVLQVQLALMIASSNAAAVGVMAGMAIDARSLGVARGLLPPLERSSTFASFTGGTMSEDDIKEMAKCLTDTYNSMHFDNFDCFESGSHLWNIRTTAESTGKFLGPGWAPVYACNADIALQRALRDAECDANKTPGAPSPTAKASLERAVKSISEMLEFSLDTLVSAAESAENLVDMASFYAKQTRRKILWNKLKRIGGMLTTKTVPRMWAEKGTPLGQQWQPNESMSNSVQDLLEQAKKACEQAIVAVQQARAHVDRAATTGLSDTMQTVREGTERW